MSWVRASTDPIVMIEQFIRQFEQTDVMLVYNDFISLSCYAKKVFNFDAGVMTTSLWQYSDLYSEHHIHINIA